MIRTITEWVEVSVSLLLSVIECQNLISNKKLSNCQVFQLKHVSNMVLGRYRHINIKMSLLRV